MICISIQYFTAKSQLFERDEDKKLVQLTGRLFDELLQPLPYAHILVLNNYRGTITDKDGKFSFVTEKNDSVMFSSLGYKRKIITIPDNLKEPFLTMDIILATDTFMIAEVEIYPWKSYEEFKEAFLNLKLPDDDMDNARKNIALLKTQIILDETPSARANFQHILDQQYKETFRQGQYPTYQIFNAFAWAEFFKALKRGDFKKYEDKAEYPEFE
ncbi:hypothetical protein ES705_47422 [subsurface metagenome]